MTNVASISQQIWDMKYRLKGPGGAPVDKTIDDTWRRVARALAAPEQDAARWEREFFDVLADFRFLPAGRIVAGAGTERAVTLFNCFVMGTIPDDMAGIFEHLQGSGAHHAAGRRHRARFLDAAAARRAGEGRRRRRLGAAVASWTCGTRCAARS